MCITIIQISKNEALELNSMGFKFGDSEMLHKSKTRHPKYYLTENPRALRALNKIRKSKIVR